MEDPKEEERELTQEELQFLEERKKEMMEYWEKETVFLDKQLKYEMFLTNIEEARARRLAAAYSIARLMAPPPKDNPEPKEETKERKLKKES